MVINHCEQKTILDLVSVDAHIGLRDDPFFVSHRPRSIFVFPIVEERSLRGVCYIDSSRENAFSKASLELVGLLTTGECFASASSILFLSYLTL